MLEILFFTLSERSKVFQECPFTHFHSFSVFLSDYNDSSRVVHEMAAAWTFLCNSLSPSLLSLLSLSLSLSLSVVSFTVYLARSFLFFLCAFRLLCIFLEFFFPHNFQNRHFSFVHTYNRKEAPPNLILNSPLSNRLLLLICSRFLSLVSHNAVPNNSTAGSMS